MADILLVNSTIKLGHVPRGIQHYPPVGVAFVADGPSRRRMYKLRKEGSLAYSLRPANIRRRLKRNLARRPAMFLDSLKNAWCMLTRGHSTVSLSD